MDRDERIRMVLAELRDTEKRVEALRREARRLVGQELSAFTDARRDVLSRCPQPFEAYSRSGH